MRVGFLVLSLACFASTAPAATTYAINFKNLTGSQAFNGSTLSSTSTISNGGTNTITDSQLTITGGSLPGGAADPFANTLTASTVFWGNLGDVGGSNFVCGTLFPNCRGLGVGTGSPLDTNEALVFNFGGDQVKSSSITFSLRGYSSTNQAYLFVDFKPAGSSANVSILTPLTVGDSDLQTFRFSDISSLNVSSNVARFAIVNASGIYGLGDLGYTVDATTPEPSSWIMIGSGLGALAFLRRRRAKN